jgi:hypothetical protein
MKLPLAISTNKQRVKYIKENIKFFFNKKIIKFKNKKHLDIGGGSGLFAIQFKDRNWNSSVLDVCKKSLIEKKYNIKHYNLNILKNRNKVRKKYNLVTIIDCLEHIKNFRKFLYEIKKNYLARDGIIFIDCPSKTNFGKININDDIFNSCHLNMWDFQSFSILAQSLNFEIISYKISSEEKNYFSFKCFLINKKKIFLKHRKSVLLASKLSNKYKNLYYTHK